MTKAARMIIEEQDKPVTTAGPASPGVLDNFFDSEDFSAEAIETAAAAAASDGSVNTLSGLYHHVRLDANHAFQRFRDAEGEAQSIYPEQPAEIRRPGLEWPRSMQRPAADWPAWHADLYERWERQCRLIDKGMGLEALRRALDTIEAVRDELAELAINAPVTSIDDVRDKLGVLAWHIEIADMETREIASAVHRMSADIDLLNEPKKRGA